MSLSASNPSKRQREIERDGELLLELAEDLEREGCPCGQRMPRCGHLIALAKAAAFFCEAAKVTT